MEFHEMSIGKVKYGKPVGIELYINFRIIKLIKILEGRKYQDKFGRITNFNMVDDTLEKHLCDKKPENFEDIFNYFICLSVCHSIIVERFNDIIKYHSSSPDESALINCARNFGFIYLEKDCENNIYLEIRGEILKLKLLNVIEYSYERYLS